MIVDLYKYNICKNLMHQNKKKQIFYFKFLVILNLKFLKKIFRNHKNFYWIIPVNDIFMLIKIISQFVLDFKKLYFQASIFRLVNPKDPGFFKKIILYFKKIIIFLYRTLLLIILSINKLKNKSINMMF